MLTPDREKSRRFSESSFTSTPAFRRSFKKESTLSKLEASVSESEALCAKLLSQQLIDSATATEIQALAGHIKSSQALIAIIKNEL